jgi:predicted TIM-barrel fold metal-dependent hydrolase
VRRNCWLTCESHEPDLPAAIEEIGQDRLMMASDYPHWDAGFPFMIKEFQDRSDLSTGVKERIMCENVRNLMRI